MQGQSVSKDAPKTQGKGERTGLPEKHSEGNIGSTALFCELS